MITLSQPLRTPNALDGIETLFQRYYPRLCFFAVRFVRDEALAEDIVQDVFVTVCEQAERIPDGEQAVKSFLYTSVKNACLNKLRHMRVVRDFAKRNPYDEADPAPILESIIYSEMMGTLLEAMESLPAGCSDILRKGFFEGLKNQEIADELSISINTVKSQKQRAISLLKGQLSPQMAGIIIPLLAVV